MTRDEELAAARAELAYVQSRPTVNPARVDAIGVEIERLEGQVETPEDGAPVVETPEDGPISAGRAAKSTRPKAGGRS